MSWFKDLFKKKIAAHPESMHALYSRYKELRNRFNSLSSDERAEMKLITIKMRELEKSISRFSGNDSLYISTMLNTMNANINLIQMTMNNNL